MSFPINPTWIESHGRRAVGRNGKSGRRSWCLQATFLGLAALPAGAIPADARSRVPSVALIERICVETDLTVSRIKTAAVSHLGIKTSEFVAEETRSRTLESVRYSMA